MKRLAIFGGTFNPIHWGHLLIAETALDQLSLDHVLWVPSSHPPHRNQTAVVDIHHRVAMVQQAIAPHPAFTVSLVDANRSGLSYGVDTYLDLKLIFPHSDWHWIIGLDAFQLLPQWHRREEFVSQCRWLVAPRLNASSDPATHCQAIAQQLSDQGIVLNWCLLDMPLVGISSSLIRHYGGDRRSIRYLVPDSVYAYIRQHQLYR